MNYINKKYQFDCSIFLHQQWLSCNRSLICNPSLDLKVTISTNLRTNYRSCIGLAGVDEANRHLYLHLHLKGTALSFFSNLPEDTRQNFDAALTSLRNRYVNPARFESHKLKFTTRKYNASKETVHDFLTELQRMTNLAFPDIVARAAADGNPAMAAENSANERNRRVKEAFIKGLPNKLKK